MSSPVLPDKLVDLAVADLSGDHMDRSVYLKGEPLADQFPVSEVGNKGQNAFPFCQKVQDTVHILKRNMLPEPAVRKNGKAEKFRTEHSVVAEHRPFERVDDGGSRKFGEGQFEIRECPG